LRVVVVVVVVVYGCVRLLLVDGGLWREDDRAGETRRFALSSCRFRPFRASPDAIAERETSAHEQRPSRSFNFRQASRFDDHC
jgi:hypothetical protein